jgi:hypothetical protein
LDDLPWRGERADRKSRNLVNHYESIRQLPRAIVERLGPKLYCSQFHKIRKHLAESGAIVGHNRSSFGEMS